MSEFNENDLVDLSGSDGENATVEGLSPEQDANIQAAMDRFMGKADKNDLKVAAEEASVAASTEAEEKRTARQARQRNVRREEREELHEDALENSDEPSEPVVAEEKTDETPEEKPVVAEKPAVEAAPEFDPNLRYFAETELGWTKEKIDRLVKADPELATETIQGFADAYTNLSRQLLNPDGSQVAPATQAVAQEKPAQQASPTPKTDEFFNNLQAFAEANGEEVASAFKLINEEYLTPLKAMFAENEARAAELTRTEARTEYTALSDRFPELYGSDKTPLTDQQKKAQAMLGQTADQLRTASKQQGRELSVKEALRRAHLLVSAEHRDQIVRKEITGQVQKRSKSILAKPTQRQNPVTASARSDDAAKDAVSRKAAELGISGWED